MFCSIIHPGSQTLVNELAPGFEALGVKVRRIDCSAPGAVAAEIAYINARPKEALCLISVSDSAFREEVGGTVGLSAGSTH